MRTAELEVQVALSKALQVDVSVDEPGPRPAAQPHDLRTPAGRHSSFGSDADDPTVDARRHLGLATSEESG
jgi:hypothetical protein